MELSFEEQRRLGERIRKLRLDLRLTQEKLAEASQISAGYVAQVETGSAVPSVPALLRIAGALSVPVSSIISALDAVPDDAGADLRAQAVALLEGCDVAQLHLALKLIAAVRSGEDSASDSD